MKTILEALRDEIHYPLPTGYLENKLIVRGLNKDDEFDPETARGKDFRGCVADCLVGLVTSPNISEGGVSISQTYKDQIMKIANSIYTSIGENEVTDEKEPTVTIVNY